MPEMTEGIAAFPSGQLRPSGVVTRTAHDQLVVGAWLLHPRCTLSTGKAHGVDHAGRDDEGLTAG